MSEISEMILTVCQKYCWGGPAGHTGQSGHHRRAPGPIERKGGLEALSDCSWACRSYGFEGRHSRYHTGHQY